LGLNGLENKSIPGKMAQPALRVFSTVSTAPPRWLAQLAAVITVMFCSAAAHDAAYIYIQPYRMLRIIAFGICTWQSN